MDTSTHSSPCFILAPSGVFGAAGDILATLSVYLLKLGAFEDVPLDDSLGIDMDGGGDSLVVGFPVDLGDFTGFPVCCGDFTGVWVLFGDFTGFDGAIAAGGLLAFKPS
mgnify:CR=1 FL=1